MAEGSPGTGRGVNLTKGLTLLPLIQSGETLLRAARISRHLMDRDAEQSLEHRGIDERGRAGGRRTHIEARDFLQIVPGRDAGRPPGVAGAKVAGNAAYPGDIGKPEPDLFGIEERFGDEARIERCNHAAVFR